MKILFIGDLHVGPSGHEKDAAISRELLGRAAEADLVVLGGDMTNSGRPEEYDRLLALYAPLADKCVPVRGNHDMGAFMTRLRSWIPSGAEVRFEPATSPVWVWKTDWFEPLDGNTACFSVQQRLPEPYNRLVQPPVIVVQDGLGPYYGFEREGFRFIVLDASTHRLGEKQQAWLAGAVAASRLPVIILMHHNVLPAGSIYDGAMLWDRAPVIRLLMEDERVLGLFAGHVHYNRAWNWRGKKIVTTAERGASRFFELKDGQIASVEPLGNERSGGRPKDGDARVSEEQPLQLRYWWADGILPSNTFWAFDRGLWDAWAPGHWMWHDPKGPGGLTWSVPPELLPEGDVWFGVNFRSTTPWTVLVERGGQEEVAGEGGPGENLLVTAPLGNRDTPPCRVILRQDAPACGHASTYMVLDTAPVSRFNRYP